MFQWNFDKPSTPINFETTLSQDLLEFNNFFSQNVSPPPPLPAQAMPPMNFSGSALSNFQEQPIIDYMTYDAPQPTEPILMPQDRKNQTTGLRPEDKKNQQQPQTMGYSTGLLDAQEGLNPYG